MFLFWNIITVPIARWAHQLCKLIDFTWAWEVCVCKYLVSYDFKLDVLMLALSPKNGRT